MKFHRRCPPEVLLEDLVSAGTAGLIEAVDRYDPRRKVQLNTLAEFRIRGAILDHLRRLDPVSRRVRRFQKKREEAVSHLEERAARPPSESEIAAELNLPLPQAQKIIDDIEAHLIFRCQPAHNTHYKNNEKREYWKPFAITKALNIELPGWSGGD
jgi:RNA polymerase sigma factor for flagellar operon FliA